MGTGWSVSDYLKDQGFQWKEVSDLSLAHYGLRPFVTIEQPSFDQKPASCLQQKEKKKKSGKTMVCNQSVIDWQLANDWSAIGHLVTPQ